VKDRHPHSASHPPSAQGHCANSGDLVAPALPQALEEPEAEAPAGGPPIRRILIGILLVSIVLMQIWTAGVGDLFNETDGQYAGAARAMVENGDWLIPYNNEVPRLVKPPLLYWIMGSGMLVFGVNEFAARLPNALGIGILTLLTFLIGERLRSTWTGFVAAILFLLFPGSSILGRVVMPEPLFSAGIVAAIYAMIRLRDSGETRWVWVFWIAASFSVFIKGLHGLLYPAALAVLAAWIWPECRMPFRRLLNVRAMLLFLAIQLPWLLAVEWRYPGYFQELFVNQQMGHVFNTRWPPMPTAVPRWQFAVLHFAWFFPWILFALAGIRSPRHWRSPFRQFELGLPWLWGLLVFGTVLAAGQRQDYYAMTAWPAVAICFAAVWSDVTKTQRLRLICAIGTVAAVLLFVAVLWFRIPDGGDDLSHSADRATASMALRSLPVEFWLPLKSAGLWTAAILAFGFGAGWWLGRSGNNRAIFVPVAASSALVGLLAIHGVGFAAPYFSSAEAARAIERSAPSGAIIAFDGSPPLGSSLCFYLHRPFHYVDQPPEHEFGVRATGEGADRFLPLDDFLADWRRPDMPVYLILESEREDYWREKLGDWHVLSRYGSQLVISSIDPFDS